MTLDYLTILVIFKPYVATIQVSQLNHTLLSGNIPKHCLENKYPVIFEAVHVYTFG